jgi:uncharacterized protein (TIGR02147 family)
MINIFEYLDYRQFLKDCYEEEKKEKPFFSYRYISAKVGLNPGYIVKLFQGKIQLGVKNISAFADLFNLQEKKREYFVELVLFGRAKNQTEIEIRFERLHSIKGLKFRTVADDIVEFYSKWYNMVIRSILSIYPFDGKDYRKLASMLSPPISAGEARDSIQLLEKLELVRKDSEGFFRPTEEFISTGEKWTSALIRDYQKKNMELAADSLLRHPKKMRDISTVTMTFSTKDMEALRERVKQFRQELLMMSKDVLDEDSVVQLNIQVFPVALLDGRKP